MHLNINGLLNKIDDRAILQEAPAPMLQQLQ